MSIVRKEPMEREGLVRISKQEAIELQWKTIFEWKNLSDIWPLKYGVGALGVCGAASTLYILGYYRRKLQLRHYARLAMNAPVAALPAVLLPLIHQKVVSEAILLQTACPVCIQIRSMVVQTGVGVLYPLILAPLTGFMYSSVFATYPLPLFSWKNRAELFKIWQKITIPFKRKFYVVTLLNCFAAAAMTELEARSFFNIQEKLMADANTEQYH